MTDRLATQLLRIARDPASGRVRYTSTLDIGLRAALFADLLLTDRLTSDERARTPYVPVVEPVGDHILDTLQRAVAARPNVPWWRWYRHVGMDRPALVDELVGSQRWREVDGGVRAVFIEADPDESLVLAEATRKVALGETGPRDVEEGVLAIIATISGGLGPRAKPRSLRRDLKPLLQQVAGSGAAGAYLLPAMLGGATVLLKRPLRR